MQKRPGLGAVAALFVGVAGCGYPAFQFGPAGAGGSGSASSSQASSQASTSSQAASSSGGTGGMASGSSSTATASSSSTAASSTGGLAPCGIGHLVISDIQTSGKNGATDEFVTLYNPTENPITIDASWKLATQPPSSTPSGKYDTRWTGGGGAASIPPHGHYLIVGPGYSGSAMPDDVFSSPVGDQASLVLYAESAPIDAVCYYTGSDPGSYTSMMGKLWYTCAGMPVYNPQDGSTSAMIDRSIARKPGSGMGSCTDSNDNALDFTVESPSVPENTASPPN